MASQRIMLRGTVTRVDAAGWSWLEIPDLGEGYEFGPCQALASDQLSSQVGMRVLVAGTASGEDLVILGAIGEEPPVVTGNRVWLQAEQPEPPLEYPMAGDLWWDTDDGNEPYVFDSTGEWISVRDGNIAATLLELEAVRATADQAKLRAEQAITDAADAQATADGKVDSYFQNAAPTGLTAADEGDLWFQVSAGYKMFRWTGTQWLEATDQRVAQALQDAAAASTKAGLAQSTADTKVRTYYQPNAPAAAGLVVGDLWVDTDEQNRLRRWAGGVWEDARDASIAAASGQAAAALSKADDALTAAQAAQATADGAIRTFYQATAPTGLNDTTNLGDLWFDTDDNFAYRWLGSANGGWKLIRDNTIAQALQAAQNAQTTADGKIDAFYQAAQPPTAELGDLWFDTDDKNKPYYCSAKGPPAVWTLVRDQGIVDALAAAEAARLAAVAAQGKADQAIADAGDAQATADGKVATYFNVSAPLGLTAGDVGDLWFDIDDGYRMYRWTGTAWEVAADTRIAAAVQAAADANLAARVAGKSGASLAHDGSFELGHSVHSTTESAWTSIKSDGGHTGATYGRLLRSNASSLYPGFDFQTSIQMERRYLVEIWARVPASAPGPQGMYSRVSFVNNAGTAVWQATSWGVPKDGVWRRYTYPVQTFGDIKPQPYNVWVQHSGDVDTAGAFLDIDDVAVYDVTEVSLKINTFYQPGIPVSTAVGDLWVDTDDSNKLYRALMIGADQIVAGEWVLISDSRLDAQATAIGALQSGLTSANGRIDGKAVIYHQATAPAGLTAEDQGDLWIDTSTADRISRVWSGTGWVNITDQKTLDVLATVNQKTTTFYANIATPPTALIAGDLWIVLDQGSRLRRATAAGASSWVDVPGFGLQSLAAQVTARALGAITTFTTATTPASPIAGDMWLKPETAAGPSGNVAVNVLYRYDGSTWVKTDDPAVQTALQAAANSLAAADAKMRIFTEAKHATNLRPASSPTMAAGDVGDLWFNSSENNRVYRWDGTAWVPFQLGIAAIDLTTITARALGGITTFSGADPAAPAIAGDLWLASEVVAGPGGNVNVKVLYRRNTADTAWEKVDDPAAQTALLNAQTAANLADAKMRIFQEAKHASSLKPASNPTMAAGDVGDLWFNTDEGNKAYVWNGSAWVSAQDQAVLAVAMQGGDLITDGGFEYGTAGKTLNTSLATIVSAAGPYSGSKALRFTGRTTAELYPSVNFGVTIQKARTYRVTVVARVPTTAPSAQTLFVRLDTTALYNGPSQSFSVPNDNTWRPYTFDVDTTTATRLVTDVWFQHNGTVDNAAAVLEIDDCSAVDVTAASAAHSAATAAMLTDGLNPNPMFDDWPVGATGPTGYTEILGGVVKELALLRTAPYAARQSVAAAGQAYFARPIPAMPNTEYVTVTLDFQVVSGTLAGSGMLVRWITSTSYGEVSIALANEITLLELGRWYRITKTVKRPAVIAGTYQSMSLYTMTGYSGFGAVTAKDVVYDYLNIRAATDQEVRAYNAATATSVTALDLIVGQKTTTFYSSAVPTATAINDLWVSTSEQNKVYRAAAVGSNEIKAGEWEAVPLGLAALGSSVSARALGGLMTFRQSTPPPASTPLFIGDLWINTASGNPPEQYRWDIASGQQSPSWIRFTSDGVAPAASPAATITPLGYGGVTISWPAASNADPVSYRVFFDTVNPPLQLLTVTGDLLATTSRLPNGTALTPGGQYFAAVRAVDRDGDGPLGAVGTGGPVLVPATAVSMDILSVNEVYGRTGYFGRLSVEKLDSGDLNATVAILGQINVGLSSWTAPSADDPGGIRIPTPGDGINGPGLIHFPADGTESVMTGRLNAASMVINDNLRILGAVNAIEGGLELANGVTPPAVAPRLGATWSHPNVTFQMASNAQTALYEEPDWFLYGSGNAIYAQDRYTTNWTQKYYWTAYYGTGCRIGNIVKRGTQYWVLVFEIAPYGVGNPDEGRMYRFDTTPGAANWSYSGVTPVQNFGVSADGLTPSKWDYAIWSDGTKIWVAQANQAGKLIVGEYVEGGSNTTLANKWTSSENFAAHVTGVYVGPGDFGATRVIITFRGAIEPRVYTVSGTTLIRDTTREFTRPNSQNITGGIVWSQSQQLFRVLTANGKVYNLSGTVVATSRVVKYSRYDNDPAGLAQAETQASPPATYLQKPRTWLEVLMEPPGDAGGVDDPNALRVYIANQRQPDLATGQIVAVYGVPITGGVDSPVSNGFVAARSAPGALRSVAADSIGRLIDLQGDGSGRVGPLRWNAAGVPIGGTAGGIAATAVARSTATVTATSTAQVDIPGCLITFTSLGPEASYRVDGVMNSQNNTANNNTICYGSLVVDGVTNPYPIIHQMQASIGNTGRFTLGTFWILTGLSAGPHTIKLVLSLNAAGSYDAFATQTSLSLKLEK